MVTNLARLLTCAALLLTLCAQLAAQDDAVIYTIMGRVVDERGKPVRGALVGLRVSDPQSPDSFRMNIAGHDGRFTASDVARRPISAATYYVSAPPADAYAPVDFMFGRFSYLNPSFAGQAVEFGGERRLDLGDVRVQAQYYPVLIELRDAKGEPLAPDADAWRNLLIRVRDARGDVVHEGGVIEAAQRRDRSAVVLALPEGTWELAAAIFGDSYNWSPLDRRLVIPRDAPQFLTGLVKLSPVDCKTKADSDGAAPTPEEARRELEKRGFAFTAEEFIERARLGNASAVRLFLAAGMNVNARDKTGQTALIASSGPWPGQTDVICPLIAAGADVNARDSEGKTALFNSSRMVNAHVMSLLLDGGADPNVQTNDGWTPLMLAAQSGQANTVRLLLEAGADVDIKNSAGETALTVAFRKEGNEVVSLLEQAAAGKKRAKQ